MGMGLKLKEKTPTVFTTDNPDEYTAVELRKRNLCPMCRHEYGEVNLRLLNPGYWLRNEKAKWNHRCLKKTTTGPCNCDYPVYGGGKREKRK
jgi:hypothetical protein